MKAFGALRWLILALAVTACHGMLDVTDPTKVQDSDLANNAGAKGQYTAAVLFFQRGLAFAASTSSVFADERTYETPAIPNPSYANRNINYDRHDGDAFVTGATYRFIDDPFLSQVASAVWRLSSGIYAMRQNGDSATKDDYLTDLFAMRGAIIVQIAENVCSGFPINDVDENNLPVLSQPYSTDQALTLALAQVDSALAHAKDTTRFINFARVIKGRTLLDLGQWAAADAAVQQVPTDFVYKTYSETGNPFWQPRINNGGYPVADTEGTNGLPFVSAHDPRASTTYKVRRALVSGDSLYDQQKYANASAPMVIASGIEARLIQAEVALHTATADSAVAILNALRATVSGLDPLDVKTTLDAQVNQLYYERAFWLWLTGHRLGDLRRLVRFYNRSVASVYPTGPYWAGGTYGTSTAIPFIAAAYQQTNPNITSGCTAP